MRVKDLLTPHFLRERLRWPVNEQRLASAVEGLGSAGGVAWRTLFQGMGYKSNSFLSAATCCDTKTRRWPCCIPTATHPTSAASRTTASYPKDGAADCAKHGADWGVLTAEGRYRLYQRQPPVGPATGQYVEVDPGELERKIASISVF